MEWLREATVLTAPDETYARERSRPRHTLGRAGRRDPVEDFANSEVEGGYNAGRRRTGLRLTFRGGVPDSLWGRVAAGVALIAILAVGWSAATIARGVVLRDERFLLQSSSSVVMEGNHHVTRADLLNVFGADLERNLLRVPLEEREAELERIAWVKHATVMRLLPDRIRVAVQERTPIAFVRQGGRIELVDAAGVLLGMNGDQKQEGAYSFPVVTGISSQDPVSLRAARMRIFQDFTRELDATGEKVSEKLSEVDLSNPEDVKALIPDHGADVLLHFGDKDYLDRYRKYEAHLAEWRSQYPKLSSVDMRYERQVVLEMQPGTAVPVAAAGPQQEALTSADAARRVTSASAHSTAKAMVSQHAKQVVPKRIPQGYTHLAMKAGHP